MKTDLILQENFNNLIVPDIDMNTFNYYGGIRDYTDGKEDSSISFRLNNNDNIDEIVQSIKDNLKLNVTKDEYVVCRKERESYETDKRPSIWIRLSSGLRGLSHPASFRFTVE